MKSNEMIVTRWHPTRLLYLSMIVFALCCGPSLPLLQGQEKQSETREEHKKKPESSQKPKEKATEGKPEKSKVLAVLGGDILTVTQGKIRRGTILIENGKITAVGHSIDIPADATQIDASGKTITPGFIALEMSRVGLTPSSDNGEKYEDALDPFDDNVKLCLGVGITTGCVEIRDSGGRGRRRFPEDGFPITERFLGIDPDYKQISGLKEQSERDFGEFVSTCPCCGLPILPTEPITPSRPSPIRPQKNAVIKMSFGSLDHMLVAEDAFLDVTPGSLQGASNQRDWRDQFEKARQYLKDQAEHEKATAAGKKEKPPRKPVSDEVLRLVQGEIALRITAYSVAEMQTILQLSQELDFKVVISGAYESWVIPQQLAEANASVVLTPRTRRDPTFGAEDRTGTWIETPRVMEQSGVPFAVSALSSSISLNGLAGRDLTSLPLEAAFAVRGGASESKALEAITIVPARMMGLGDRLGSIEVGKDADLLVLNGPPLDYRTYVETAVVNGRVAYERSTAKVLPVYSK